MGRPTVNIGRCKVEGCTNEIKAMQMCVKHYERFKKFGNTEEVLRKKAYSEDDRCLVKDCNNKMRSSHLCNKHYTNFAYHKNKGHFNTIEEYILSKNN